MQFNHPLIEEVIIQKLDVADYQAIYFDDNLSRIVFERKGGFSDLWKTMTSDYERFRKEVIRAKEQKLMMYIVINGSFTKVMRGFKRSKIKGITIIRTLFTLWLKYDVHHKLCNNEEEMVEYMTQMFIWGLQKQLFYKRN